MCELCGGDKKVTDEKMQALVDFMVEETGRRQEEIKQVQLAMAKAFTDKTEELGLPAEAVEYAGLAAAVKMGKMSPGEALMQGLMVLGGRNNIRDI